MPSFVESTSDDVIEVLAKETVTKYLKHFDSYKIDLAANIVLDLAINTNLYLNEKQPWSLIKEEKNIPTVKGVIYCVLESTRIIGMLLMPLLPDLSSKINLQLGSSYNKKLNWSEQLKWGLLKKDSPLPSPSPIIEKLEYE